MTIRMFGAACAALLILAASAVASPETAMADGNDDSDVVLAPIDFPAPPKTQEDIAAEKDEFKKRMKRKQGSIVSDDQDIVELKKRLEGQEARDGRAEIAKGLRYPAAPVGPWKTQAEYDKAMADRDTTIKEWWALLTPQQRKQWNDAAKRDNNIAILKNSIELREASKEDHEGWIQVLGDELKIHCIVTPLKKKDGSDGGDESDTEDEFSRKE